MKRYPCKEVLAAKAFRDREGISQAAFAEMIDVTRETYQQWELGIRAPGAATRTLLAVTIQAPDLVARIVQSRRPRPSINP